MKNERIIEEIKSRIDIVELISDYVPLKKSGQNYKGLCPFHSEKTPSFIVSPLKQIFHCFGCGEGGDIVSFIIKYNNITFSEAIEYLAKRAGLKLTDYKWSNQDFNRIQLFRINEDAILYFIKNLKSNNDAQNYIKKRGLNEDSIKAFNIGLATDSQDGLYKYLKEKGFQDVTIKASGLGVQEGDHFKDFFRRRLIFPIYNSRNEPIAFGGRVMDNSLPKYINIPETPIFKKSQTLFGINIAKDYISKTGFAIIVEGYIDTITCHQYGFKNTIAPLGTALTQQHLNKLKLFTEKIILTFDSDKAGILAAKRSLKIAANSNFRARILLLPEGEDPDSFLRRRGSLSFEKKLSETLSIIDFIKLTSSHDKVEWVREALEIVSLYDDVIIANEILCELTDKSRFNESILREELEKIKKKNFKYNKLQKDTSKRENSRTHPPKEEYLLLSALLSFPENLNYTISKLKLEDFYDPTIKKILEKIKTIQESFSIDNLSELCDDKERILISKMLVNPGFDNENVNEVIDDCIRAIKIRRLEEQLSYAKGIGDVKLLNSLLKEKRENIKGNKL
jgi:DNA primase